MLSLKKLIGSSLVQSLAKLKFSFAAEKPGVSVDPTW